MELTETQSALKEIENSGDEIFKVAGQLMIKTNKENVKEELDNKIKILDLRIKTIEKQEASLIEKLEGFREKVMKEMKK